MSPQTESHITPPVAAGQGADGAPPTAEDAATVTTSSNGAGPDGGAPPRLAPGIELVGRYEDSGFKEPPYIARRSDGQMVQMPQMLFALAEVIDGEADEAELACRFTERIERQVEPDMVRTLLDNQLRPLGVVAPRSGAVPDLKKADPLLALKFRTKVVPERLVNALTTVFRPLFLPPVVVLAVLAFLGLDVWLFGIHGISQGLRGVIYEPTLLLMLLGGVVVSTTFHEIGHATGTRYGGAKPGVMGVGIYIVWPAFYTDITDAYRLGKAGRLRADLGGMYFNAIFGVAVGGLYALTGFEPLLLLVVLQTFTIIQQSLPLLRLDGFYIISDLTGVPDMLTRIKPVLSRLIPGREPDPRVLELKPWVRRTVTGYVFTVVPIIALLFVLMMVHAPRAFATGYDSLAVRYSRVGPEFSHGQTTQGLMDAFQMLVLLLPLAGMVLSTGRVGKRTGTATWSWSAGEPARRAALLVGTAAAVGALAFVWWPNGDYRPIQTGEKGTVLSGLKSLRHLPTGQAAVSPESGGQDSGASEAGGANGEDQDSDGTKSSVKDRGNRSTPRSRRPTPETKVTPEPGPGSTSGPKPGAEPPPASTTPAPGATTPDSTAPPTSTAPTTTKTTP